MALSLLRGNLTTDQVVIAFDNTNSEKLYAKAYSAMLILNDRKPLATPNSLTKAYAKLLNTKGKEKAEAFLQRAKNDTLRYSLVENDINNLGYAFLENNRKSESLVTFELGTRWFPHSDNMFNSYGEALASSGKKLDAIDMYRKSLAINPKNEDSKQAIERLMK